MGNWTRIAGNVCRDWSAPRSLLQRIDFANADAAFTELLIERTKLGKIRRRYSWLARGRLAAGLVQFHRGNAMARHFDDGHFDAASKVLVSFSCPIRHSASPRWRGWFDPVARHRPMLAMASAAGCRSSR